MDVTDIIKAAGGPSRIAREISRSHATVIGWQRGNRVPAEHARDVAKMAGLDPSQVRPDLYDAPAPDSTSAAA